MLTGQGIEANPDKCAAIINMRSPTTVKEVQKLTGRVAALARFLSKSGNRAFPFYQCLKKNDKFQWTNECEEAFLKLKVSSNATNPYKARSGNPVPLLISN